MNNKEVLRQLLEDLRGDLGAIAAHPVLPFVVKNAVSTTFQILEILIAEVSAHE